MQPAQVRFRFILTHMLKEKPTRLFCRHVLFLIIVVGMLLHAPSAESQAYKKAQGPQFSLSTAPVFQLKTDLDRGGAFNLNHFQIRGSATKSFSDSTSIGLSIGYDFNDYEFSGNTAFAGPEPWSDTHRISFSIPLFHRAAKSWRLFVNPSIDWSGESSANFSDALRYGVSLSALYRFHHNFSLGVGAGVFHGLEETRAFPFLMINWKINEKLLLTNPFSVGPIGPAGLELVYTLSDLWVLGSGGAFRSNRFRLDNDGVAASGIGQSSGLPAWIRMTRKFSRHYKLDLYGGVLFNGELRIENRDGHKLGSDDFDPAAFMAANLSASF